MVRTRSASLGPGGVTRRDDQFGAASAVADAVLYEGYLLYPYRRSSGKNRIRWQFGVLAPRSWITAHDVPDPGVAGAAESWFQHVECLAEAGAGATVRVRLRFLQVQRKQAYDAAGRAVDTIDSGDVRVLSFDEGLPREIDEDFRLADLLRGEQVREVGVPDGHETEPLAAATGCVKRTTHRLRARLIASAEVAAAPFPLTRLRLRVENAMDTDPTVARGDVLQDSLVATHLVIALDEGHFLSLLDPPAWAADAAAACANRHVFPVLAGVSDGNDVLLCSPIILYDHPKIAPESPGDLHDATEIDEILSLRTLTLTEDEKREARATDPRAAAIVDHVDKMGPELLARLHGAVRDLHPVIAPDVDDEAARTAELPWWDPSAEPVDPQTDSVLIGGYRIAAGSIVRLHPRRGGTDPYDMFLAGRSATVHAVLRDVDGTVRVAVTVDGDPAAELHQWYGRFFHFEPEEIEPVGATP